jgi:hypothetical protein
MAQTAERPESVRGSNVKICNDVRIHQCRQFIRDCVLPAFRFGQHALELRPSSISAKQGGYSTRGFGMRTADFNNTIVRSNKLYKFMDPTGIGKMDYIGRCLDNAVYIGLGSAVVFVMPYQIKRKLEAGKLAEAKAASMSKIVRPLGCLMIAYGIFRVFVG